MGRLLFLRLAALAAFLSPAAVALAPPPAAAQMAPEAVQPGAARFGLGDHGLALSAERSASTHVWERFEQDLASMQAFRPGYAFWQHVFTIPDGSIAFGRKSDGKLVATFPTSGDWTRSGRWEDESLAAVLEGQRLERRPTDRRDQLAALIEPIAGPVLHNSTRGDFLMRNVGRYGSFLGEWAAIYERFGVPAELGLAQAIVESGLNGNVRSEARAVGFCQWLPRNWKRLQKLASTVIEAPNQTTQAPYCAAYLTILATKYGTFIPALSEHHAGGSNVGRTVINGERLGGGDVREQYFLGAEFARDLRSISRNSFKDIVRTYGPRSFLYAEMVFGNTLNVKRLVETTPQEQIFAARAPRAIPLAEITRRTGLSVEEVRRFNPALVRQVPKGANVYLPFRVEDFGFDASFWHRPASPSYVTVLNDFVRLEATPEQWDDSAFDAVLRDFRKRFEETRSEEGAVMAAVLGYVMQETSSTRRILAEYRASPRIRDLFERGVLALESSPEGGSVADR